MVWFKVDDHFHSNRKVKKSGLEAIGLWSVSGSYCAAHLTDGFIEEWFIKEWRRGPKLAEILVGAGLWYETTKDGEKGWQFHDWDTYQPTKEQVEAERKKARERKAQQRLSRGESHRDSQEESQGESRETPVPYPPDQPARPSLSSVDLSGEVTQVAPSTTCPKHPSGTELPCRGCADARRSKDAWDADQQKHELARRRTLKAIKDSCPHCDEAGWVLDSDPAIKCQHPEVASA